MFADITRYFPSENKNALVEENVIMIKFYRVAAYPENGTKSSNLKREENFLPFWA